VSKLVDEKKIPNLGVKGIPFSVPGKIVSRGSWRTHIPVIDEKKCVKCHLCWLYCPDTAIKKKKDGFVYPDLALCKGCHICAEVCPVKAITMVREKK